MLRVGLITESGPKETCRTRNIGIGDDEDDEDEWWDKEAIGFAISDAGFVTVGESDIKVYSVQESPITLHEEARLSERLNPDSGSFHMSINSKSMATSFMRSTMTNSTCFGIGKIL